MLRAPAKVSILFLSWLTIYCVKPVIESGFGEKSSGPRGTPVFEMSREQKLFIENLFEKILAEQNDNYFFKNDLIRNYTNLIIREALKMQPYSDSTR